MSSSELKKVSNKAKRSMRAVFVFSFVANVLLLTSPLFMLQVYDRVLLSRSEETLLGLFAVGVLALLILWVLETVRNRMLTRIGNQFDQDLGALTYTALLAKAPSSQPIHDLNGLRQFIASPFVLTLLDMPWTPLYIALVYLLHPMLGHVALVAVVILFLIAILNDRGTQRDHHESSKYFGGANRFVEHSVRHKDAVLSMGMSQALVDKWTDLQQGGLGFQSKAADRNAVLSSFAKTFRQFIQIAILAVGAWLTIQDLSTAGVMIAASIIAARALAPVEQSIQGWRNLSKAKENYANLDLFLHAQDARETVTTLPEPSGHLMLQNVFAIPAIDGKGEQGEEPLIRNVSLALQPGQVLGIAGASGSGKSTLMRLMAGVILPMRGTVRVDGAELTRSLQTQFSQYIGYLPQDVELFDGTIAENIARFTDASDEAIVKAAQLAGAHELILSLKEGYQTQVGPGGLNLSGGQRQRVGLARALFGSPKLVFLDEPTSNLDEPGTMALLKAVQQLKTQGVTIVVIAHQPRLFLLADLLAVMKQGVLETLGPTREVLEALRTTQTDVAKQNKSSVLYSAQMKTAGGESPKEQQEGHE